MPKIMDIEQGSQEWLNMKFTHFGGSYAATIMGESPYCTPYQLWHKMIFKEPTHSNGAMERGKVLEPISRKLYENNHKVQLSTPVVQSDINPLAIVSLDGCRYFYVNEVLVFDHVIETKAYGLEKHNNACTLKIIPQEALWQCVHICWVLNISSMTFLSYNPDCKACDYVEIIFNRSQELEDLYLPKLDEFIDCVRQFKEPQRSDKDYYDASKNEKWMYLEHKYIAIIKSMKLMEEIKDQLRGQMIEEADGMSVKGNHVRLTRVTNKGRIRYESIPELKSIDLEPYRGISYTTYRISEL